MQLIEHLYEIERIKYFVVLILVQADRNFPFKFFQKFKTSYKKIFVFWEGLNLKQK